eukprot:sb/3475762/
MRLLSLIPSLLLLPLSTPSACVNEDSRCDIWAAAGLCDPQIDNGFMRESCRPACGFCPEETGCSDNHNLCATWAGLGLCTVDTSGRTKVVCSKSCNMCGGKCYSYRWYIKLLSRQILSETKKK